MNKAEAFRGALNYLGKPAAVGAAGLLALSCSGGRDAQPVAAERTTTTTEAAKPKLAPTLPPTGEYAPDSYGIVVCYSENRTMKAGDTVFDLTTEGLHDDEYFMNRVFAWNLEEIEKASATNEALKNANDIPIGTKFKILTNCVQLGGRLAEYDFNKQGDYQATGDYTRDAQFQNFTGTDGITRNLVTVRYESNASGDFFDPKTNEAFDPIACSPSPDCYKYVPDAPKRPADDIYLP